MSTDTSPLNQLKGNHCDLINSINGYVRDSAITYYGIEIEGHRDDYLPFQKLIWWEQRNVEMNDLAKSYMQQLRDGKHKTTFTSHSVKEGWSVVIDEVKISGNYINAYHDAIYSKKICRYWDKIGHIEQDNITTIDFQNMKDALSSLTFSRRIWFLKYISGFCATGVKMFQWKKCETDTCPLCNER